VKSFLRCILPDLIFIAVLGAVAAIALTAKGSDELRNVRPSVAGHCVCDSNRVHSVDRAKFIMGCTETAQHTDCPNNILSQLCAVLPFSANLRSMLNSIPHVASRGVPSKIGYVAIEWISIVMASMHSIWSCADEVLKYQVVHVLPYPFSIHPKSDNKVTVGAGSLGCHAIPGVRYMPLEPHRFRHSAFCFTRPH